MNLEQKISATGGNSRASSESLGWFGGGHILTERKWSRLEWPTVQGTVKSSEAFELPVLVEDHQYSCNFKVHFTYAVKGTTYSEEQKWMVDAYGCRERNQGGRDPSLRE